MQHNFSRLITANRSAQNRPMTLLAFYTMQFANMHKKMRDNRQDKFLKNIQNLNEFIYQNDTDREASVIGFIAEILKYANQNRVHITDLDQHIDHGFSYGQIVKLLTGQSPSPNHDPEFFLGRPRDA